MKIALMLVCLLPGIVNAQTTPASTSLDLPLLGSVDLNNLIQNAGAVVAYDNHGTKWAGANLRVAWTPADPNQALVDLEVGALWDPVNHGAPAGVTTSIGIRLDNVGAKLGTNAWLQKYLGHLPLPSVEIGPFAGYLTVTHQWVYGAFLSKRL